MKEQPTYWQQYWILDLKLGDVLIVQKKVTALKSAIDAIFVHESVSSSIDIQPQQKKPKMDKLFNFMENEDTEDTALGTEEIDMYLMAPCISVDTNPAEF